MYNALGRTWGNYKAIAVEKQKPPSARKAHLSAYDVIYAVKQVWKPLNVTALRDSVGASNMLLNERVFEIMCTQSAGFQKTFVELIVSSTIGNHEAHLQMKTLIDCMRESASLSDVLLSLRPKLIEPKRPIDTYIEVAKKLAALGKRAKGLVDGAKNDWATVVDNIDAWVEGRENDNIDNNKVDKYVQDEIDADAALKATYDDVTKLS